MLKKSFLNQIKGNYANFILEITTRLELGNFTKVTFHIIYHIFHPLIYFHASSSSS